MAFQGDSIFWVEVEKIVPNPFQPRREFDEEKLKELSESIKMYGVLQPLTVTRKEVQRDDGTFYTEYELIAGERRLRASKLAGLSQVPVIIREGEDSEQEKLELAIIENLQREDLNAVDRALAFKQLSDTFGLSHTLVAKKVGRSREYVSNSIRLLALPESMLTALKKGDMTEGHARTLLMLNDKPQEQDVIFREILLKKLSVREVERIVRKIATDKVRKKNPHEFDDDVIEMEKRFMETLGTRVQILKTDYGGRLTIDYFSAEDLEDILNRMKRDEEARAMAGAGAVSATAKTISQHTPLSVQGNNDGENSVSNKINDFKEDYVDRNQSNDNHYVTTSVDNSYAENKEQGLITEKTENNQHNSYEQNNQPQVYLEPKEQPELIEKTEEVEKLESAPEYEKIEEPEPEGYLPPNKTDTRDEFEDRQIQDEINSANDEEVSTKPSVADTIVETEKPESNNNFTTNNQPVSNSVNEHLQPSPITKNDNEFINRNTPSQSYYPENNEQKSNSNVNYYKATQPPMQPIQSNPVNQSAPIESTKADDDEGDLYSIRNFTI